MKKIIFIYFLTVIHFLNLNAQSVLSAKARLANGTEGQLQVLHDSQNNLIISGYWAIPSGPGGSQGPINLFIEKYDSNNVLLWAVNSNSNSSGENTQITDIAIDNEDNVYFIGSYNGTSLNIENLSLSSNANSSLDIFFGKINANGTMAWLRGVKEDTYPGNIGLGNQIHATKDGNILVSGGYFKDIEIDTIVLTGNPAMDAGITPFSFYAKFDSEGNVIWAKKVTHLNQQIGNAFGGPFELETNRAGEIYMAFGLDSAIVIGNSIIKSSRPQDWGDMYAIIKTDASGNLLTYKIIKSTFNEIEELKIDHCGNVLVSGSYIDTLSIDNQGISANSERDVFVAKLDENLSAKWVKNFGSNSGDRHMGLSINDKNELFFGFEFWGQINYGNINYSPSPVSSIDVILIKLDTNGNIAWFTHSSGNGVSQIFDINVAKNNQISLIGRIQGQENFSGQIINGTSGNLPDAFFVKFSDQHYEGLPVICLNYVGLKEEKENPKISSFPNPVSDIIFIKSEFKNKSETLFLYNTLGQIVFEKQIESELEKINVSNLKSGLYFLKTNDENSKAIKIIVQ